MMSFQSSSNGEDNSRGENMNTQAVGPPKTLDISKRAKNSTMLSPETPSSMFGKTLLEGSKGCVVIDVVLSYWDNILGPRIRHLWYVKAHNDLVTLEILNYIANHTLSGEICRDPGDSNIDSKLYVLKDRQLVVTSFIFSALGKGDIGVHSLSVIVDHKDLNLYLTWQHLTISWMQRGVAKLRILLEKTPEVVALSKFSHFLSEFVSMFSSIREAPVSKNIPLQDTAFHPQHGFNRTLVHQAILAHLSTCGRSLVIGKTPGRINMMIATLAMFLRPRERTCCRYVSADKPWSYHSDLCVQGLLLIDGEELGDTLKDIYFSQYPTALIDLVSEEVKLSSLPNEHRFLRQQAMRQELGALWKGQDPEYPTRDMFRRYDEPDSLVTHFVEQMDLLPLTGKHREVFVVTFMQMLEKRAFTLIKYVEANSYKGRMSLRDNIKRVKQDLSLLTTGDFNIVLATAERLKPDIYSLVCGEPQTTHSSNAVYE